MKLAKTLQLLTFCTTVPVSSLWSAKSAPTTTTCTQAELPKVTAQNVEIPEKFIEKISQLANTYAHGFAQTLTMLHFPQFELFDNIYCNRATLYKKIEIRRMQLTNDDQLKEKESFFIVSHILFGLTFPQRFWIKFGTMENFETMCKKIETAIAEFKKREFSAQLIKNSDSAENLQKCLQDLQNFMKSGEYLNDFDSQTEVLFLLNVAVLNYEVKTFIKTQVLTESDLERLDKILQNKS